MAKVITFSRKFPAYHPKAGQPTYFVEKFRKSMHFSGKSPIDINCDFSEEVYFMCDPKHHTIRSGNRFKRGDYFSPRVWSGKPYNSKQIIIGPDTLITDVWKIKILWEEDTETWDVWIDEKWYGMIGIGNAIRLSNNDGLTPADFKDWFKLNKKNRNIVWHGQIICWNPQVKY